MLNTKAKVPAISAFTLLSLVIFAFASMFACSVMTKWYGIIVGLVLMIAAIPFHCRGKDASWCYMVSFLINSTGNGFALSAVFIKNGYEVKISDMLLAIIPSAVLLLIVCLVLQLFGKAKKATVTLACIADVVLIVIYIIRWITKDNDVFDSFAFFSLLITFFYLCVFGFAVNHENRKTLRFVSFGSFGAFIAVAFVAAFVVSEGDVLDGIEVLPDTDTRVKKKKVYKQKPSP